MGKGRLTVVTLKEPLFVKNMNLCSSVFEIMWLNRLFCVFDFIILCFVDDSIWCVFVRTSFSITKKSLKKSLSERGSTITMYIFKGSVKGYNTLSSLWFLYVSVNSLSLSRSWRNKFDNWSTLCTNYPQE